MLRYFFHRLVKICKTSRKSGREFAASVLAKQGLVSQRSVTASGRRWQEVVEGLRHGKIPDPWTYLHHSNGYIRQAALEKINGPAPDAEHFLNLFHRLNDWVPQVRASASQTIRRVVAQSEAEVVADVLWSHHHIFRSWRRWGEREYDLALKCAERAGVAAIFAEKLLREPAGPSATRFRLVARSSEIDHFLNKLATGSVQPAVRVLATDFLLTGEARWQEGTVTRWVDKSLGKLRTEPLIRKRPLTIEACWSETIERACNDPAVAVRRVAGSALIVNRDVYPDLTRCLAGQLAGDPNSSVAERGKFVLRKLI